MVLRPRVMKCGLIKVIYISAVPDTYTDLYSFQTNTFRRDTRTKNMMDR